jgi:protein TonB
LSVTYPDRAVNGNIQGRVQVLFIVDKEGDVIDPYIWKSVEYSLDDETMRVIRESGQWEPVFQNGRHVKSYKLQPLNFKLE